MPAGISVQGMTGRLTYLPGRHWPCCRRGIVQGRQVVRLLAQVPVSTALVRGESSVNPVADVTEQFVSEPAHKQRQAGWRRHLSQQCCWRGHWSCMAARDRGAYG